MNEFHLGRRLASEAFGTGILVATVVGSGIMGDRLAAGNDAVALLANTAATGAGARSRLRSAVRRALQPGRDSCAVLAANVPRKRGARVFRGADRRRRHRGDCRAFHVRGAPDRVVGHRPDRAAAMGGGNRRRVRSRCDHIWMHSFPAVRDSLCGRTVHIGRILVHFLDVVRQSGGRDRRSFTDTFSGIRPLDLPGFILAEFAGVLLAAVLCRWLFAGQED